MFLLETCRYIYIIRDLSVIMERDEVLRILLDWNYWGDYKDEGIERRGYIKELNRLLKTGEIAIIKGVRRAGKSTLMLQQALFHPSLQLLLTGLRIW